jgi:hypothetical protein
MTPARTLSLLSRRFDRRTALGEPESGVALLMALFVMLLVSTLAVTLLAVVLNETKPTGLQRKLTRTIDGADGGLQVVLNQLRAANDGTGAGVLTKLPCTGNSSVTLTLGGAPAVTTPGAVFSGSVAATSATAYTADVSYFSSDPSDMTPAQLASNAMSCPLTAVPGYAFVQSAGRAAGVPGLTSTTGNRSVHGTYQFSTSNVNVAGGRILEFGTTLCLTVADTNPHVGSQLIMSNCKAFGTSVQMWAYRTDLTLLYEGNAASNLCVQGSPADGSIPTLQPCTSGANIVQPTTYGYVTGQQVQEWGFNDSGHFSTANSDGSVTNGSGGTCLQPSGANDGTPAVEGTQVIVATCDSGTSGYTAWNPDPQVGAGKAGTVQTGIPGAPTYQLVNYQEFGRCLDITGQDVTADHLIDYPCKQAPDSTKLTFNQVWTFSGTAGGTGTMSVTKSGTTYCLTAPASGNLTTVSTCGGSNAVGQSWLATGKQTGNYTGSYEFISRATGASASSYGLCLTADSTVIKTIGSSTITVASCDGSAKQKWNAPPNALKTNVTNLNEDKGND